MKFIAITAAFIATLTCTSAGTIPSLDTVNIDVALEAPGIGGVDVALEKRQFEDDLIQEAVAVILENARKESVEKIRGALTPALNSDCPAPATQACQNCVSGAQTSTISEVLGCGVIAVAAAEAVVELSPPAVILGLTGFAVCKGRVVGAYESALFGCKQQK